MFNKPSEKINLNSPDPNSDIYISEGERFNKDFAAYDYNRRNIEHERKKEMYQNRKNQLYERERKRWEKMDYEYLRAENKIMMNKERNLVGRKNNPGMAFNPLTLQYDNSVQGEILKKRDDESKFRALMRATNIDKHANAGYNIINGEERTIMENRMLKEIEPSVYKKNINRINEINQRHNDNDNFYTKGPYTHPKSQFQEQNDNNKVQNDNNEYQKSRKFNQYENDFNNIPPQENNYQRMTPSNHDNKQMMPNENNFNNIPQNENNYKRETPKNNIMPPNDNYNNNLPPNDQEYKRMTPNNMPPNDNYQRNTPNNNYNNIPLNDNYQRNTPNNNYDNIPDNREYNRAPYNENNYRKMTPSNYGYNQPQNDIPDHYSEPDKRYQNIQHDFDRQYNYIDNRDQNNYNQRDGDYNGNRDPYARPDYYANNKPRTMS